MLYISQSTYFKFRFVDSSSFDKQGQIIQVPGAEFDATSQSKNKEKLLNAKYTSERDLSAPN